MIATMSTKQRTSRVADLSSVDAPAIERSLVDASEFDAIYERHHDVVFRYLVSRLGPANAEDVLGDVFLAAYATRARFDANRCDSALPWLLGIATRRIARHRDMQRRWIAQCGSTRSDGISEVDTDQADERADAARMAPELASALSTLRPRDREPLLLHVLGGLTYEEVAVALELPVGTVRSRISRARVRLAGILDGVGR